MNDRRWTDDDLILMWQLGREYVPEGLAEAIDDAHHAAVPSPRLPYEARVALRIAEMELRARSAMDRLRAQAERNRARDRMTLALAGVKP